MIFRQLFDQETSTYTYLLGDSISGEAVLIDPVVEKVDRDLALLDDLGLTLKYSFDTHVHADHVTGSGLLRERTGARTVVGAAAKVSCADRNAEHGERFSFGPYRVEARATPGHTDGCMTYVVEDGERTMAFTGDALLIRGSGRTDFQQGDAHKLYASVHSQIFTLPDDTIIYPGHDYKGHSSSTVAEEKAFNPRLNTEVSEGEFVDIVSNLNLAHPKKIDLAVPANLSCGRPQPEPHTGKVRDLEPSSLAELRGYRILDVRQPEEFTGPLGHLPGAESVPLATLEQRAAGWSKDEPFLLVCRSGARSSRAAEALVAAGFRSVTNLVGGMQRMQRLMNPQSRPKRRFWGLRPGI